MNPVPALVKRLYERPYVLIFMGAVALSAHGLFTAAVRLGRIPPWLAWLYVLIVDLLAVAAFRTWRRAARHGSGHWAWVVAAATAAMTVAMNALAAFPAAAPMWAGPVIAAFPPLAALLATALHLEEQRLHLTEVKDTVSDVAPEPYSFTAPEAPAGPHRPVTEDASRPRLAAIPPVTDSRPDTDVADIVAGHVQAGGQVADPGLTVAVAAALGCSDRTARRRLQPFRGGVAA